MDIKEMKINGLIKRSGNSWYIKLDDKGRALITLGMLKENQEVDCLLDLESSKKNSKALFRICSRNLTNKQPLKAVI